MTARNWTILGCLAAFATPGPADAAGPVSFTRDVAPILARKCLGCHNDAKPAFGLNMSTFALLKKGGKGAGETVLEPGDPDASYLIESVRPGADPRMPYKLPPLEDREIKTLEAWVKEGASFDAPSETDTLIASLYDPLKGLPKVAMKANATDAVTSVAFSPDGSKLAAAVGREVRLFDAAAGKPDGVLGDHPGPLTAVRFTSDGKSLVAAGGRAGMFGAVTVWDVAARSKLREFRGHSDMIQAADVTPDGSTLATGGYDRAVILWDLKSGEPLGTLRDHTDAVHAVAFSADGKSLATAGADRTVKVWDVAARKKRATLGDATAELYAVAFTADGRNVLAGGVDRSIREWALEGNDARLVRSAFAHDGPVLRLLASGDGKTLISSGEDRTVRAWELPGLKPIRTLAGQSDWPLAVALSPDAKRLAVGRYDGSVGLFDASTGEPAAAVQTVKAEVPAGPPQLVRNATHNPPAPRGAVLGSTVRVTLSGNGVGGAVEVLFAEPGLSATPVKSEKPDPNKLEIDLTVSADARPGVHRIGVVTPLGVPAYQTFSVEAHPAVAEVEPNDGPPQATPASFPATLVGTINKAGDVDHFRFDARAGRPLVVRAAAKGLGSNLLTTLTALDDKGNVLAEAAVEEGTRDPSLVLVPKADGPISLRVADADYGGSGGHFYRIAVGEDRRVDEVFPLGVAVGGTTEVAARGVNLGEVAAFPVAVDPSTGPGALIGTPAGRTVVAAEGAQGVEAEPNDAPNEANAVATPGGVSGRIGKSGDMDVFAFDARKGRRLVVEVYGGRLGTPIDPFLEVLDERGSPVPRAILRPVAQTEVAFRDHNASGPGIRLTHWNELAINDYVLIGREVARVFALPKNPDDDCQFWSEQGQRSGFFETTPEHHPMGRPIYKFEAHPPGSTFPTGGVPPVTLHYRNDDGGPSFKKDARVTFDPPADGRYLVRVADVRGLGGPDFGYHLVVREPRPDAILSVSDENPNVHRGGTTLVPVSVTRIDGFDDAIEVSATNLPPGIMATPALIERGGLTTRLALTADATAPAFSAPTWTVRARALRDDGSTAEAWSRSIDPGGPTGGRITVIPPPNLTVTPSRDRVVIRPGQEVTLTLKVDRGPAFKGRVPIDVRNLPQGVRVLNIGLNGVLVTESQTERTVTIYAEPWAPPMTIPFFAVGKAEAAGTEHSSRPIALVVEPASTETTVRADGRPAPVSPRGGAAKP